MDASAGTEDLNTDRPFPEGFAERSAPADSIDGQELAELRTRLAAMEAQNAMPENLAAERVKGFTTFVRKPFQIFEVIDLVGALTAR